MFGLWLWSWSIVEIEVPHSLESEEVEELVEKSGKTGFQIEIADTALSAALDIIFHFGAVILARFIINIFIL
jgi:hypothetical protein